MKVNTNPEMNTKIANILSISTNPMHLYAAERIRELEAEVEQLKDEKRKLAESSVSVFITQMRIMSGTGNGIGRATVDKIHEFAIQEGFISNSGSLSKQ